MEDTEVGECPSVPSTGSGKAQGSVPCVPVLLVRDGTACEGLVTVSPGAAPCLRVALASVWLCQRMAVGLAGHPGMDAALTSHLASSLAQVQLSCPTVGQRDP